MTIPLSQGTLIRTARLAVEGEKFLILDYTNTYHFISSRLQKSAKLILAVVFIIFGYLSLVPALFWTFIYKWFTSFDDDFRTVMTKYASKE